MPKALTNIKHSGGWIDAGEEVEGVSDEEMEALIAEGAIEGEGPNEEEAVAEEEEGEEAPEA